MSMIQFPSDHKDYGNQRVAGSQSKANNVCAKNMRKGAIQFRAAKTKGETTGRVVQDGKTAPPPINVAGVLLLLIAGMTLVAAGGMVFK